MTRMIFLSIIVLVFAVVVSSCDDAGVASDRKLKIGVSIPAATHGWTGGLGWWAETAMKEHPNVYWVYLRAATSEQQVAQIENMMAQGIDGLVVLCAESAPLTPIGKKVKERGIYLFSVDRGFTEPIADVFLEGDNHGFGRKAAEFMANKLEGRGDIVVLTGIPCTVDTFRREGFMEVIKAHPGIRILDQQPSNWNEEKSMHVMHTMLAKHPKIDAVWAQDDGTAKGAAQAIKEAGREREMWVMGGAGRKDVVKEVMEGNPMFPADVTYSPAMIAAGIHLCVANLGDGNEQAMVELMPKHLGIQRDALRTSKHLDSGQRDIKLDVHLITPENAKDFYFPESVY